MGLHQKRQVKSNRQHYIRSDAIKPVSYTHLSGGGDGLRAAVGADGGAGVVGVAVADFGGRAVCCRRRPYGHRCV